MTPNKRDLKAYSRFDGTGRIVPGSTVLRRNKPKVGNWIEVQAYECCDPISCTPNYSPWRIVTGGVAGDGVVLIDNTDEGDCPKYTFVGPNNGSSNGWVYLTQFFATETCLSIPYEWTSFDEGDPDPLGVDWPVYWNSSTQPTGIPGDLTVRVSDTPDDGTWNITVPAGQWFSLGIYSDDSCCGRGFLSVEICEVACSTTTTTTLPL